MSNTKQQYTQAFKDQATSMALLGTLSISRIAEDLGIPKASLYNWVQMAKGKESKHLKSVQEDNMTFEECKRQLKAAQKELAIVKQEREILKAAAKFFANQTS